MPTLESMLLVVTLGAASLFDARTRRVPNALTVGAFGAALALRAVHAGAPGLLDGVAGAGLALALVLPFFLLRALGGGDVKLLAACGAVLGWRAVPGALACTAIAGTVLALALALRAGTLVPLLRRTALLTAGRRPAGDARLPDPTAVPYVLAISVGVLGWWFGGAA